MTKFKKRKEEQLLLQQGGVAAAGSSNGGGGGGAAAKSISLVSERFGKIFKKTKKKIIFEPRLSTRSSDENSSPSSPQSNPSDIEDASTFEPIDVVPAPHRQSPSTPPRLVQTKRNRKSSRPLKYRGHISNNIHTTRDSFASMIAMDANDWSRRSTCCGIVWENSTINAVILDTNMFNAKCTIHSGGAAAASTVLNSLRHQPNATNATPRSRTTINDASPIIISRLAGPSSNEMITKTMSSKLSTAMMLAARNLINNKSDRMMGPTTTSKLMSNRNGTAMSVSDKLIDATISGNKFNDNSSDSGYDEILQEPKVNFTKKKIIFVCLKIIDFRFYCFQKSKPGVVVRPVILSNGIKLHVQPQNLAMAANLAGVSRIHSQVNTFLKYGDIP